ncbi:MAG: hypothetical protein KDN04_05875 [Verrucomicrobiae bacterium]|nr:hypothetical protein [Verrucomicrobiae bacterium]
MSELPDTVHDDALVDAAKKALRFRYRAFLSMVLALGVCVAFDLLDHGSVFSRAVLTFTGVFAGIGVPWLLWHLRVPFAARVAMAVLLLSGQALNGQDPRENLSPLAATPVVAFLIGWGIDVGLRQEDKRWSFVGRLLFSSIWLLFAWFSYKLTYTNPEAWADLANMGIGIAIVWLPRQSLLPARYRLSAEIAPIVTKGLQSAGAWITNRTAIAILILLPSVIYLDLRDFPPRLRADLETSGRETAVGDIPGILYWKREARAFRASDLKDGKMEVHLASRKNAQAIIEHIRLLRADPKNGDIIREFESLSLHPLDTLGKLAQSMDTETVFYLDRSASGDQRVTAGILTSPDPSLSDWVELRHLSNRDITRLEHEVDRATFAILASGILIILLLGGPSGGVPAAWWLAILLAGTNLEWVGESLGMGLYRARFVIWREYADHQVGATLFSLHTLLVFFIRTAEWLTASAVTYSGIWVALCWPGRKVSPERSRFVRFWRQGAKVALISVLIWVLRALFVKAAGSQIAMWNLLWHLLLPLAFFAAGHWQRRRLARVPAPLPTVGRIAVLALLLRSWWPLLSHLQMNSTPAQSLWIGSIAVSFAIVSSLLLIIALERGSFLSPPHVEGQVWLIGVAAIPFLENVVGEPVFRFLEQSGLFLGTTVGWLAFAAAVWGIGPIAGYIGERLARWRAHGLDQIEMAHENMKKVACSRGNREADPPLAVCSTLFESLGIHQPQLWRHLNGGIFTRLIPTASTGSGEKLISRSLAETLGEVGSSLRLEEMRLEWKWAPYHFELDQWFDKGGDLLLIPATHQGCLLGIFCAPDLPENRFLLRPAVSGALGETLAFALLLSADRESEAVTAPAVVLTENT